MPRLFLRSGTVIEIGQELGRGGEGSVYSIEGRPDQVAKIYTAPPSSTKIQKLTAMVDSATPDLLRVAAWPMDLLIDSSHVVRGFVMPRIMARRDIHELYSPRSRAQTFPEADFRFLVHVSANIARAFAVIHERGHVIGDVNHGNLLVGTDGTVMLIDCDSFQIGTNRQVFTCDVGVPLFTAPELQGRSFRGLVRSQNHDLFALAVLLFHLLYMGRHPFAGRYRGPGEMPIEKAIAEYRFAYGGERAIHQMDQPPGTIALETLGVTIASNFERAFSRSGAITGRPDARAWISALDSLRYNLQVCPTANWHHFPRDLNSCPWCSVERQTGVRLFGTQITVGPVAAVDLATLWQAIIRVPGPGPDPTLPSARAWHPPAGVVLPSRTMKDLRITLSLVLACCGFWSWVTFSANSGVFLALICFALAVGVWPRVDKEKRRAVEAKYAEAKSRWDAALSRWKREASESIFVEKLKNLEQARAELADLPNERQRRLAQLEAKRESMQRQRYLDQFRIDRARIQGIGDGRASMLASYGIETAADIEWSKISQIPGFGEVLTRRLVDWRCRHEANFHFNPHAPIDPRDIQEMERFLESRRQTLLAELQNGPMTLTRLSQDISEARSRLLPIIEDVWNSYKIAEWHKKSL